MIDPLQRGCRCEECPFSKDGRPARPVGPEGDPSTAVGILVGKSPGHDEVAVGRPFVGQTGRALDAELVAVGLDRKRLYIVNAVACLPANKNATSLSAAVRCCAPLFQWAMARAKPTTPVFAMGRAATSAVGIKAKVRTGRGFLRRLGERWAIISWHPTYAMFRHPYEHGAFSVDLERFAQLTRGEVDTAPPPVNIKPTTADIYDLVDEAGGVVGADIETAPANQSEPWTGLDPLRARLKTIALGSTKRAVAHRWGSDAGVDRAIRKVLCAPTTTSVWHNGVWFDHPVLRRYGVRLGRFEDTRDLRRALSATSRLSLLHLASLYTDFHAWKVDEDGEKFSTTQKMEDLLTYNGYDSVVQVRCYHAMKKELDNEDED